MATAPVHGSVAGANDKKKRGKVEKTMGEFKRGNLRSGSKQGPPVRKRSQAVAIALKQAGKSKYSRGTGGRVRSD
jgi:hypothetical protein